MPFWWLGRRSRSSSKRKEGPVSACCATPSTRSLGSPMARLGADWAATASTLLWAAAWSRGERLPQPVPFCATAAPAFPHAEVASAAASRGGSPVLSGSSSKSDVVDNQNHRVVIKQRLQTCSELWSLPLSSSLLDGST